MNAKGEAVTSDSSSAGTITDHATRSRRWLSRVGSWARNLFTKPIAIFSYVSLTFLLAVYSCISFWIERPIFVDAFTVETSPGTAGIDAAALADRLKAKISQINADSGNLYEVRKLSDSNLPLDVKVGKTGLSLVSVLKSLGFRFTTAEISGHVSQVGTKLALQLTVSQGVPVHVESPAPIELPAAGTKISEEKFLQSLETALDCFAVKVMIRVSPDVAANHLHTLETGSDLDVAYHDARAPPACVHDSDVDLYSKVRKNRLAPAATQINALVGLSVHYGEMGEFYEELNMASAATELASQLIPCEDPPQLSFGQRIKCLLPWKRNDRDHRAHIAAWMQLGAAYSDQASVSPNQSEVRERRANSITAYSHLITSTPKYALAFGALGVQQALLLDETSAAKTYEAAPEQGKNAPLHMDHGLALIHGRRDSYVRLPIEKNALDAAEEDFRTAIQIDPNYWDAHARLGYVLFEQERFTEAAEVLQVALAHDRSNRPLRRLLGSVLADSCQFDPARRIFSEAYQTDVALEPNEAKKAPAPPKKATASIARQQNPANDILFDGQETLVDWGKVLDGFGLHTAALEQETDVIRQNPSAIEAYVARGQIALEYGTTDAASSREGFNDLSVALALDRFRSQSVLQAYLAGLVQAGNASLAESLYKYWADEGIVPSPIGADSADIRWLTPDQRLRVTYAQALAHNNEDNTREQMALGLVLLRRDVEIVDIVAQSLGIVGDEHVLDGVAARKNTCVNPLVRRAPHLQEVAITGDINERGENASEPNAKEGR